MTIGLALLPDRSCRGLASFDDLATLWTDAQVRVWVDLEAPSDEDLRRLDDIINLDDDSLDDCLYGEQRPRIDEFEDYIFLVLYGLYGLKEQEDLDPHKLAAYCGKRFLITVHREPVLSVRQIRARCARHPRMLLRRGVDAVLFAVIDTMVDHYLVVSSRYETRLETLEDQSLSSEVNENLVEEAAEIRREVLDLRRLAVAQRQLLLPLAKGEYDFISETLSLQFLHVCDHLTQVIEMADSLRETVASIRDNYHAALTRRTNEIVKMLTLYAGVLLPLTLIAGIYGMNLQIWPPPGHPLTFWGVLTVMGGVAGFMFWFFRRQRWL